MSIEFALIGTGVACLTAFLLMNAVVWLASRNQRKK